MTLLSRKLEDTWEKTNDVEQLTARTEARVLLKNLVHYTSRGQLENDVLMAAATLLWFRRLVIGQLPETPQSNIMSEEQVGKLARQLNDIVQKFHLGITEPNEMVSDLVIKLQEAGIHI